MRRAFALARRGEGRVEPNPMVGCVIVRGSRIVGEGYHHRFGHHHAEVFALRAAGRRAAAATAYVTLEPCGHTGKTPPCTDALIAAKVKCVVAAMSDPAPEVAGRGFRKLRAAGIEVRTGCLNDEARRLTRPYVTRLKLQRPYIILKWAQSLDGWLSAPDGKRRQLTGQTAARIVHRLRARVDAIIVGANTAIVDNPLLTARDVPIKRTATRVILDSRLRIPPTLKLVRTAAQTPTIAFTQRSRDDHARAAQLLTKRGVAILPCRSKNGHIDLHDALHQLYQRGMSNILIEAGPTLATAFLAADLADEVMCFVAPEALGPQANSVRFPARFADRFDISHKTAGSDALFHAVHRFPVKT